MPNYSYTCTHCNFSFDRLEKISKLTWQEEEYERVECPRCGSPSGKKTPASFKIGSGILETTGKSGYLDDKLTLGKLVDEGGIPAEEKRRLYKRDKMIKRQQKFTKELNARAKKYDFSPYSDKKL